MTTNKKIGIIGLGKMGEALISGLLRVKALAPINIYASDINHQRRNFISETYGINCSSDNFKVVEKSNLVFLAVTPRDIKEALMSIKEKLTPKHILVSMAAGVKIDFIHRNIGENIQVIRAMPNICCFVAEGMIAVSHSHNVSPENLKAAIEVFSRVGKVVTVEEERLNAITALSGSGPAYIYLVIEALADAGVKAGLPRELSITLAAQTTLGSAVMMRETGEHPAKLRDLVTTPAGTTIEGISVLEKGGIRSTFFSAVVEAAKRADELSTKINSNMKS